MTTATESDDTRLGRLEGQMEQQSIAIQELSRRLDAGLQELRQELRAVNARIDRLFLATWAIGGGIIAALVVQIVRTG
jgi:uncharacterized coiled-coil protein SlyX